MGAKFRDSENRRESPVPSAHPVHVENFPDRAKSKMKCSHGGTIGDVDPALSRTGINAMAAAPFPTKSELHSTSLHVLVKSENISYIGGTFRRRERQRDMIKILDLNENMKGCGMEFRSCRERRCPHCGYFPCATKQDRRPTIVPPSNTSFCFSRRSGKFSTCTG